MSDKKFVCNINVKCRYNTLIMAGTPFTKEQLVDHTFIKLTRQGHIQKSSVPVSVISEAKGVPLASINATVPSAALHPPVLSAKDQMKKAKEDAMVRAKARESKALKTAAEAAEKAQKASDLVIEEATAATVLSEDEEIQKLIDEDEVKKVDNKKESTVENIWICDPDDIRDLPFSELLTAYRTVCNDNNIELKEFGEGDKGLLIEELSSQFQK